MEKVNDLINNKNDHHDNRSGIRIEKTYVAETIYKCFSVGDYEFFLNDPVAYQKWEKQERGELPDGRDIIVFVPNQNPDLSKRKCVWIPMVIYRKQENGCVDLKGDILCPYDEKQRLWPCSPSVIGFKKKRVPIPTLTRGENIFLAFVLYAIEKIQNDLENKVYKPAIWSDWIPSTDPSITKVSSLMKAFSDNGKTSICFDRNLGPGLMNNGATGDTGFY